MSEARLDLDAMEQTLRAAATAADELGTQARFSIARLEAQRRADKHYRELGQRARDLLALIHDVRQRENLRQEAANAVVELELLRSENAHLTRTLQEQAEQLEAVSAKAAAADEVHEANARLTQEHDALAAENARLVREIEGLQQASPDDLRAAGWHLAVHSDQQHGDEVHTSWLFTKGDRCLRGEGRTDAEALAEARGAHQSSSLTA